MGWRGNGWRASFSPSVDSVTHPWAATQTRHTSTSLGVISNKRIIMALVKSPRPFYVFYMKDREATRLGSPDLEVQVSLFALRTPSTITHPSIAIISPFGQAQVVSEEEWVSGLAFTCAGMCCYMYLYDRASERERKMGADVYLSWQDNSVSPFLLV